MTRTYERVEGDFKIYQDGRMFIGKTELKHDDETLTLSVKQLRQIISDARCGLLNEVEA